MRVEPADPVAVFVGPVVVCVRGPSRSGKTSLCERVIAALEPRGVRVAYLKRTHHELDLPEKASGRAWLRGPSAMVLRSPGRLQLTVPPGGASPAELLAVLPDGIDLVLFETHSPEPYPTVLSSALEPVDGEEVLGRWLLETVDRDSAALIEPLLQRLPADHELDHVLRAATKLHGGHLCAGLVLGTRLALHGAAQLGIEVPDRQKRLIVAVETDRCAVDAIQAVTGCRPGKRTLRLLDYGKLAATFIDQWTGTAVRVATRGDLRDQVQSHHEAGDRHEAQKLAYLAMTPDELYTVRRVSSAVEQFDLPGPPRRRVTCATCGEEVSDGREIATESGPRCRPCAAADGPR
jgi:formylmethanofuran dehydrogenase subunit E